MAYSSTTRTKETLAEFTARRKKSIGGSDIASVMSVGKYSCARKLFFDKSGKPKDKDDSDAAVFRRGHRLEHVAANYYVEKTGREVAYTTPQTFPGKPHLSVTMDRLVFKKEDTEKKNPGYLEIKVLSVFSMPEIKKLGMTDDYLLQIQYGMAITGFSWGAFAIYCPDSDDLLFWDVEADKELGAVLLERADDFWELAVGCRIEPDALPPDSKACKYCPWFITCRM